MSELSAEASIGALPQTKAQQKVTLSERFKSNERRAYEALEHVRHLLMTEGITRKTKYPNGEEETFTQVMLGQASPDETGRPTYIATLRTGKNLGDNDGTKIAVFEAEKGTPQLLEYFAPDNKVVKNRIGKARPRFYDTSISATADRPIAEASGFISQVKNAGTNTEATNTYLMDIMAEKERKAHIASSNGTDVEIGMARHMLPQDYDIRR